MNYTEAVHFLYSLGNEVQTAKFDLERITQLLDALGDPHFRSRARWLDAETHGAPMLGFPAHVDSGLPNPGSAPSLGEHAEDVLRAVGWPWI